MAGSKTDALGIFWLSWDGAWTLLVAAGMGFLWTKRRVPLVRVRGIAWPFAAVTSLHFYWMTVQAVYIVPGQGFPQQAEFWIMGTYLPVGIALFHASNTRFLYIAEGQKKFVHKGYRNEKPPRSTTLWGRIRGYNHTKGMLAIISVAIPVQILATIITWLLSKKFHPHFGIPGTEVSGNPWEVNTQLSKGWEWWPSIVYQFIWSWVIAPFVLWKSRRIHDTLGWRFQTIGCCLASLHAVPMWLVALYVPAMKPVNKSFVPPQWIAISIMLIEIFTIFVPCWQVVRQRVLREETLQAIIAWENNKDAHASGTVSSKRSVLSSLMTLVGLEKPTKLVDTSHSGQSLLSMGALEHVLSENPDPLREFSSLKDFSGENVSFLTSVSEWKADFPLNPTEEQTREHFTHALRIYTEFISPRDADFPINISFRDMKKLEGVFEKAARIAFGNEGLVDLVVPFESTKLSSESRPSHGSERPMVGGPKGSEISPMELRAAANRVIHWGPIPDGFDAAVFDQAANSIKYLVLTNTWPKFVAEKKLSGFQEDYSVPSFASDGVQRKSWGHTALKYLSCDV